VGSNQKTIETRCHSLWLSALCSIPCRTGLSRRASPTKTQRPPSSELWLHEIKHDGFRVIARKNGVKVRLYSRPGNDLA
jgi:ATP-dependent DNA ligase